MSDMVWDGNNWVKTFYANGESFNCCPILKPILSDDFEYGFNEDGQFFSREKKWKKSKSRSTRTRSSAEA